MQRHEVRAVPITGIEGLSWTWARKTMMVETTCSTSQEAKPEVEEDVDPEGLKPADSIDSAPMTEEKHRSIVRV